MDLILIIQICVGLGIAALVWHLLDRLLGPFLSGRGGNEIEEIQQEMTELRDRMEEQYARLTLMLDGAPANAIRELGEYLKSRKEKRGRMGG